jgi:ABC-type glycerol-3-phosphate transport system substrate-binding protein
MTVRNTLCLLLAVSFAFFLSCQNHAADRTVIKVAARAYPFLVKYKGQLEENFQKRFNKKLELILLPMTNYEQQVVQLMSSGDNDAIPDVVELDNPRKYYYYKSVTPLDRWIKNWNFVKTNELAKDFVQLRQDESGSTYGLCLRYPEPSVMVVRPDWLAKLNLPPPTSIEELTAVLATLATEAGKKKINENYICLAWNPPFYHLLLLANNGSLISYNAHTHSFAPGFTTDFGTEELTTLCRLNQTGALPASITTGQPVTVEQLFKIGGLAMGILPMTKAVELYRAMPPGSVDIIGLPRGIVKPANGHSSAWAMVSLSAHQDAAWSFMQWWFSPETFRTLSHGYSPSSSATDPGERLFPPLLSIFELAAGSSYVDDLDSKLYPIILHERMVFQEHPFQAEVEAIVQEYYLAAMAGTMTVEAAIQAAVDKIKKQELLN